MKAREWQHLRGMVVAKIATAEWTENAYAEPLAPAYSGRRQLRCRSACFKRLQALAYVAAQQRDRNPSERRWIAVEPPQSRLQQKHGSQGIIAVQVMERRSHLDQPL